MNIRKSYEQNGAALIVSFAGNPERVETTFNRCLNFGMVQIKHEKGKEKQGTSEPQIVAGRVGGEFISFKSNLTRFNSAIAVMAHLQAREVYKARGLRRGFRKLRKMKEEKIRESFVREASLPQSKSRVRGGVARVAVGEAEYLETCAESIDAEGLEKLCKTFGIE